MCGIVGAVGLPRPPEPHEAAAVLDAMAHRGPDGSGTHHDPRRGVWLGFRRLAILDLRAVADQPMTDEATGVTIVFNGEIYNYLELRRALEAEGHRFRSTGDTEVVLRGWLQWGTDLLPRCNGMFALAVDDPSTDGVVVARDRFGEKPLYVARRADGSWWFASEVATLRAAGAGTSRLDRRRTLGFLAVGDIDAPSRTFVEGIDQLPPGTHARLTATGLGPPVPWWDLAAVVAEAWDAPPPTPEAVRDLLDTSVRLRLRSDVEVGTSLSGGLDSTSIVASLRAVDPDRPLHAFTASFPGRSIDEWARAELVGARYGVTMHRVEPTLEGFIDEVGALVRLQGAPFESPTVYAQWCVMRAARDADVTVLLDGQGADETWGGYPRYVGIALTDDVLRAELGKAIGGVRTWRRLGSLPRPPLGRAAALALPASGRRAALAVAGRRGRRRLGPAFAGVVPDDPFTAEGLEADRRLLRRIALVDLRRGVLPRLLRYADRNSMAWSREVRLPFLDPALVTAGLASGWSAGMHGGWTKGLLRDAMAPRLPDAIVRRRDTTAYETPTAEWLADDRVVSLVGEAAASLHRAGVLAEPSAAGHDPWRILGLGLLVEGYALTA
jgi:asparagine synthase (glutamine-hydrolysing)